MHVPQERAPAGPCKEAYMAREWANRLSQLEAACQLAPNIRAAADRIDAARELPDYLIAAIVAW